jgi:TRAP-type uncharacterized transport system substrate-binding protein
LTSPLDRPLATRGSPAPLRHVAVRLGAVVLAMGALAFLVSRIDFTHDMHRMHVRVLTGERGGRYYGIGGALADRAAKQRGVVENESSFGSTENLRRLAAAGRTCEADFALVQDGSASTDGATSGGDGPSLRLIGRLPRTESVLFLGKEADHLHEFAELRGLRIGVGPRESGTDRLGRQLFALPEFASLGVTLSNHPIEEQLAMAGAGDLDLALLVVDADAPLVVDWIGHRGLQIASFTHAESVSRRLSQLKTGRIPAGFYDAVENRPPADKVVMKVETLVLENGCASRAAAMDFIGLLAKEFPELVRYNKDTPNTSGITLSSSAADFYANDGPQLADEYAPWLVNVMPPANWAYIVMGVSLLFNAMGFGHRFRLWRIDAARVKLEDELGGLFPPSTTLGDIQRTTPGSEFTKPETVAAIERIVGELGELARRSRRYSLSALVPMGQEMAYRYQEGVIYETLAVLRDFKRRCEAP